MYLFPQIHEKLYNVLDKPIISICSKSKKKKEFLDN